MSLACAVNLPYKLIAVTGSEQLSYLHGQLTQDMNLITEQNFLWGGHCSPKGKLWGAFRIFKHQQSYMLLGSEAEINASSKELKKYGVFAKVEIDLVEDVKIIGIQSTQLNNVCDSLGLSFENEHTACDFGNNKALKLDNTRLLLIINDDYTLPDNIDLITDPSAFIEASILAGEPQLNEKNIEEFVPQMINLQALDGISFKKGCYTGQETVARMRYLGKNKRAMYIVQGTAPSSIDETDLELQLGDNWRRAGKVVHQVYNEATSTYSALTILPNDTDSTAHLRAKNSPEVALTILPLPYSLDDQ
ncbi:tRNA-modifying protein YgfZ [Pseudoalteromonas holothuriae]|uniref:tRNA-modifying protein YgfZ n=1 Tax=Pseudoalteromonas holothuriae TaxID=2963714 RepID=A0A9W4QS39_9GAMM|nr:MULTISPECIES: transcriptional regulator [unclassified Pseudoalteromonas]CAH9050678.1 tRNA-modifying protein YgfZ [Pseudoalteromonas sp. CIP111854]CAH9059669.1 tRNA-modifying protein YgfZ [Pseudoalteromonas sp. CIP111951]